MINAHKCSFEWFIAGNSVFRSWAGARMNSWPKAVLADGRRSLPAAAKVFGKKWVDLERSRRATSVNEDAGWSPEDQEITRGASIPARDASSAWTVRPGRDLKSRKTATRDASCHSRGASGGREQETRIPVAGSPVRGCVGRVAANCRWKEKRVYSHCEGG